MNEVTDYEKKLRDMLIKIVIDLGRYLEKVK
jgi:hypothetical protein